MEEVRKLPSTQGIANPLGKSRRERPRGKDEDGLEKKRNRQTQEEKDRADAPDPENRDNDPREQAPEEEKRGLLLDEKA